MFNPFAIALMIGAGIALALSWKTPRAWYWIGLGGAAFVASSLYWDYGDRMSHTLFAFTCDALFVLVLHLYVKEQWELPILGIFLVSAFINLLKLGGFIPGGIVYASLLELCNWLALLWISGVGLTDLMKNYDIRIIHRVSDGLHRARDTF
jgi:hypothetical protein